MPIKQKFPVLPLLWFSIFSHLPTSLHLPRLTHSSAQGPLSVASLALCIHPLLPWPSSHLFFLSPQHCVFPEYLLLAAMQKSALSPFNAVSRKWNHAAPFIF